MTDVIEQEQSVADPEGTNETAVAEPAKEKAAPAPKAQPHSCLCSFFEVAGKTEDEVFSTGCEQTTMRMFAQGHDARLISFLVDGHFDGYTLRMVEGDKVTVYATPAEAAARASEALVAKAIKATANRQATVDTKSEREAKKAEAKANREALAAKKKAEKEAAAEAKKTEAAAPKATGAEVVAGSAEGDQTPLAQGQVKIKVGRWEYNAEIDENGVATYVDGKGEPQSIERDGYRLLAE